MKRPISKMEESKESNFINNESQMSYETGQCMQWSQVKTSSNLLNKRSHHGSAIVGNKMYIYGGYEAGGQGILSDFMCFNLQTNQWKPVLSKKSTIIGNRQSHSLVAWKNKLILFGGFVNTFQSSNKVFSFQVEKDSEWKEQTCKGDVPPGINSHKAVIYEDKMIIIGGQQEDKYNEFVYQLNLTSNQWKKVCQFTKQGLSPRSDFSLNLHNSKLYLFCGKNEDLKYNQLWQYSIEKSELKKVECDKQGCWPVARSGHCACIYKGKLVVFGGTTGVTHERNDLIVYDIQTNRWYRQWPDEQSQLYQQTQEQEFNQFQSRLRSSPSNTVQRKQCNNLSQYSSNPNQNQSGFYQQQNSSNMNTSQQAKRKYRQPMRNENYYNHNYPFYGDKQGLLGNKHKKNDLLVDLEKQTKEQMRHNHQGERTKTSKVNIHMSQTFQSITNTMMTTFAQANKNTDLSQSKNEDRSNINNNNRESNIKQPKSRDGHSCQLYENRMIIFGGDRHHMSFNDVIIINLDTILMTDQKH